MERAPTQETYSGEKIEYVFEHIVQESKIVGSGKDGIVFRVELGKFEDDERKELDKIGFSEGEGPVAAKVLKIYNPELGKHEFDMHRRAASIIAESNEHAVCRVPDIALVLDQHITPDTTMILNSQGAQLQDRAEILVMDFIDGKDLGTIMYDFVLAKEGFDEETIDEMNFAQKELEVGRLLAFEIPDVSKAFDRQAIETARAQTFARNEKKLKAHLRRGGFILEGAVLERIKKTVELLHAHGLYHNDLHKRNVMISGDGDVFLIDFGRASLIRNEHGLDDASFVNDWKELALSIEDEIAESRRRQKAEIDILVERFLGNKRQQEQLTLLANRLHTNGKEALRSGIVMAQSNDRALEFFLVSLVVLYKNEKKLAPLIEDFIEDVFSPQYKWRPFEKNLIKRFIESGAFDGER